MTRRMRVLGIVVLAVLLGSMLAVEVNAGRQFDFYSPGGVPYDSALLIANNNSSELSLWVNIYFENEQGTVYGPFRLLAGPMSTAYGILHDSCCIIGGVVHIRMENLHRKDFDNWTAGVMWVTPCAEPWGC